MMFAVALILCCLAHSAWRASPVPLGSIHRGQHPQLGVPAHPASVYEQFRKIKNVDEFKKRVEHFADMSPKHDAYEKIEHEAQLKAMAYFFKVYDSNVDHQLQHARHLIEKYAGKDRLKNTFKGRAAMFKRGGRLEQYAPLVHELASLAPHSNAGSGKHPTSIEHSISLIEEHIENGFIEIQEMGRGGNNIQDLVSFDPLKESRKINSENEYFRKYDEKRKGLRKRKAAAVVADEIRTVAKELQNEIDIMKEKLATAEAASRAGKSQTKKAEEERSKEEKKEKSAREMGEKAKERQRANQKLLLEAKEKHTTACKAVEELEKQLEKNFERQLCGACSDETAKLTGKRSSYACDCEDLPPSGSSQSLLETKDDAKQDTLSTKDKDERKAIIDFDIVPLPTSECKSYGGTLFNKTECRIVSSKSKVHTFLYMFGPKASSQNTAWKKDKDNIVRLDTKFSQFDVAEINIDPVNLDNGTFHWTLPESKRVEIEMHFQLYGEPYTSCNSLSAEPYDADITTFQQQDKYDEHNPFFEGELSSGKHKMSWSKSKLEFAISNYSLGKMQRTIHADPEIISVRVPYESKRSCSKYSWDQKRAGRLEVRIYPFEDPSCVLQQASQCAVSLVEDVPENTKALSKRLCSLLKKVKIPALAGKIHTLCPADSSDAKQSFRSVHNQQQRKLEESEKNCEHATLVYKKLHQDTALDRVAVEATETLVQKLSQKEEEALDDACDGDPKAIELGTAQKPCPTMTPEEIKQLKSDIQEKEKDLEDVEEKMDSPLGDDEPPKAKDKIVCLVGADEMQVKFTKSERIGEPGSNGGPNKDGDANSAELEAGKEWPNGEPPAAASLKAAIESAHEARVKAWKSANGAAKILAGAGGTELGKSIAGGLSVIISKVGRLAGAMAGGLAATQWMGKESAPWIYNGRSETLCKIHIVEKKDWCNRKNNDVLEKCGVPDRISATICEIVLNFVTDPGIETTLKSPPPVGIGPAPPFVMPNCLKQGKCQKPCGDDILLDMIDSFKDEVKKLVKISATVGEAMAKGATAAASAAQAMSFLEKVQVQNELVKHQNAIRAASLRKQSDHYKRTLQRIDRLKHDENYEFHQHVSKAVTEFIESGGATEIDRSGLKGGLDAAIQNFGKAVLNGYAAEIQFRQTHVDLEALKLSEAEGAGDVCLAAKVKKKLKSAKAKLQLAQDHQKKKEKLPAELKEQAEKMKKGASPTQDRTFKTEVPFGDMTEKFECPKLSIFGCGCGTIPGHETLDGPDCKALKAILASQKKWEQKKVDAENFYNKGLGESKQMEAKVKECEEEGNLLD